MNKTVEYDPRTDLIDRWPDWRIERTDLHGLDELIAVGKKLILIDTEAYDHDPTFAVAHALAHIDLHRDHLSHLVTIQQEAEATMLADIRLDREGSRC